MPRSGGSSIVRISLLTLAAASWNAYPQNDVPNLILANGRVFTGVDSRLYAQAIAIKGSRIIAVGSNQEILATAGPETRRIDVGGRVVIPGINDAHVHFDEDPIATKVDFGNSDQTCAGVLARLGQAARSVPRGTRLVGTITPNVFFDAECTPAALDRAAPEDAVVVWTPTLHAAMLNSTAARKFNVRTEEPPVLGGWFGKNMKSTRWDGVVHEYAWFRIFGMLPSDRAKEETRLRRFLGQEARWGVTSITLIESKPARRVEMLSSARTRLRVRVVPSPLTDGKRRLNPDHPSIPARVSDRVSASGVKWWLDGSPFERSSAMRVSYADDPSTSGQINFAPEEIRAALEEARQQNTQVLVHTVGDRTAETLLRVMESMGVTDPWPQRRLRIEHGDGLMPDLVAHTRKVGAIVVQNPTHFKGRELYERRFGPNRAATGSPLRSLLAAGVPVVLASDGAAGEPELNPYLNIMLAREYPGKPNESLSREQAVIAYTRTAAYAEFADDKKGTLEPGKLADLTVLSQDIFNVAPESLPATEAVLTMVNGEVVYTNRALLRF